MVALDGVMATALGVAALSLASEEPAAALIPLGVGALYLGGAVSGNRAVNKCREAIADYEGNYEEEYVDTSSDRLIPRAKSGRPSDPYSEQPAYPPPRPSPPQTAYTEQPAYPPPQPPPAQQPPPQQPPVQQPPTQSQPPVRPTRPPAPPPQADDDWSDFWREVP